ncbi:hypothetical protein WJX84_002848 [Apatococcus fuscideae]|uniref:Uncharacterized protein n=1 Tax=Apatococcus fuscideae TaxID=2026836 RepID=A0AAW1TBU7_9CHLO
MMEAQHKLDAAKYEALISSLQRSIGPNAENLVTFYHARCLLPAMSLPDLSTVTCTATVHAWLDEAMFRHHVLRHGFLCAANPALTGSSILRK